MDVLEHARRWTAPPIDEQRADPDSLRLLGTDSLATQLSVRRLVLVIVPLWLLAIGANALTHRQGGQSMVVLGCAVTVAVAYAAYARLGTLWILCAVLVVTALLVAMSGPPIASLAVFPVIMPWLNMATTVVGALIRGPWGAAAVIATALGGAAPQALVDEVDPQVFWGIVAQGVVGGLCMWAGIQTLRQAAAALDAAASRFDAATAEAAREEARIGEARRLARVLHDTVINTLGAIRALPLRDVALTRRRCAEDLEAIVRYGRVDAEVTVLLTEAVRRARVLGIDLDVRADSLPLLPQNVAAALQGALNEALVNVAKHSGSDSATLHLRWDGRDGLCEIADHGRGFRGRHLNGGGRESILSRCREAGIAVTTFDREGAMISLSWSRAERTNLGGQAAAPAEEVPAETFPGHLAQSSHLTLAAIRIGVVMSCFGIYSIFATPPGPGRAGSAVAVLLTLALVAWVWLVHIGRAPSSLPLTVIAVAVAATTGLPGIGMTGCSRISWYWWGPLAGLIVMIVVVLVDGRARAVATAVISYIACFAVILTRTTGLTPDCSSEALSILLLDLGIVAAIVALRRALSHQSVAAEHIRQRTNELSCATAALAACDEVRNRDLARAMAVCEPLLSGIADGSIDPRDPGVRLQAGDAEATLRSIISLPPELGELGSALAACVFAAAARGARIRVNAQQAWTPSGPDLRRVVEVVQTWSAGLAEGAEASITLLPVHDEVLLLLSGPESDGLTLLQGWSRDTSDGESLLETSWPADYSSTNPSRTASR